MSVINWTNLDVKDWLIKEKMSVDVISVITYNVLDGPCILSLNERDFSENPINTLQLRDRKRLFLIVKCLQKQNQTAMIQLGLAEPLIKHYTSANVNFMGSNLSNLGYDVGRGVNDCREQLNNNEFEPDAQSRPASEDGRASRLKPEVWKAFLSLCKYPIIFASD